jgi:protein arginine N-methyltransferase 1
MVADEVRTRAYARALERTVRPDTVVLDIGTGTGIFALLACRYGARRVFAVDPSDSIEVARQVARDNALEDRIEFIHAMSTAIELPERADVIVCDLRGILPLFQHSVAAIIDARSRHLGPGGSMIPLRDVLYAAPASAPAQFGSLTAQWQEDALGFDLGSANRLILNSFGKACCGSVDLVGTPSAVGTVDYPTITQARFAGGATFVATRDATAHGWVVWFDTLLAEGVELTNAPGNAALIYGQAFFPWERPVQVRSGDPLSLRLRADVVGDGYLWSWESEIRGQTFRQSELGADALSPDSLRRRSERHVPELSLDGRIELLALELMQQGLSLGAIASRLERAFPQRFPRWTLALDQAADIAGRCGR